jgi:RNA polymerase sigma factor (TIGR02999 family)
VAGLFVEVAEAVRIAMGCPPVRKRRYQRRWANVALTLSARIASMDQERVDITELLGRWKSGDRSVESDLITAVYPVLRAIANAQIRRNAGALTMQATELANEAYAKLIEQQNVDWQNRDHFYAISATVIRRVIVDYQRMRGRDKRGGGLPFVALDELREDQMPAIDDSVDWLAVDKALTELAVVDAACAHIVVLKFFSGLSTEKIAEVEGSSVATVGRQWRFARAWLGKRLGVGASAP